MSLNITKQDPKNKDTKNQGGWTNSLAEYNSAIWNSPKWFSRMRTDNNAELWADIQHMLNETAGRK
ncbi:hypothetical protein AWB71_06019 [Caballeronia peredens]|nr:hypothetical protein AWB71_06019 [Caballeronia peredens]